jgi:hypothetical protein
MARRSAGFAFLETLQRPGRCRVFRFQGKLTMADYCTPTVIQPTIPSADITPLERLILGKMFSAESDEDGLYFYAEEGVADVITVSRTDLKAALDAAAGVESCLHEIVTRALSDASQTTAFIDLDLSTISFEWIFQDVVKRSKTLQYVTAVSSFTCSKMRPDGFGGMAILITAGNICGKSTNDILEDFLGEAGLA